MKSYLTFTWLYQCDKERVLFRFSFQHFEYQLESSGVTLSVLSRKVFNPQNWYKKCFKDWKNASRRSVLTCHLGGAWPALRGHRLGSLSHPFFSNLTGSSPLFSLQGAHAGEDVWEEGEAEFPAHVSSDTGPVVCMSYTYICIYFCLTKPKPKQKKSVDFIHMWRKFYLYAYATCPQKAYYFKQSSHFSCLR